MYIPKDIAELEDKEKASNYELHFIKDGKVIYCETLTFSEFYNCLRDYNNMKDTLELLKG